MSFNRLRQYNVSFIHKNVVNLCISDELNTWLRDLNTDFTLGNYLFANFQVRIIRMLPTKNADPDKYGYSGYGIEFDACSQ